MIVPVLSLDYDTAEKELSTWFQMDVMEISGIGNDPRIFVLPDLHLRLGPLRQCRHRRRFVTRKDAEQKQLPVVSITCPCIQT